MIAHYEGFWFLCDIDVIHRVAPNRASTINPNPTLFRTREASKPYSRGQWDTALKATPHSPKGDVSYVRALEQTVRSGAHGFRSRRPRSLLGDSTFVGLGLTPILFHEKNPGIDKGGMIQLITD